MAYLVLEVDIDHGKIVPREPGKLPEKGRGVLTVMSDEVTDPPTLDSLRPAGLAKGEFQVSDDFNAPLPDEIIKGWTYMN